MQRLSAAWELSAGISHNLNNILTGVLGPAQILMKSAKDTDTAERAYEILDAGTRARDLIRQLYTSTTQSEFEPEAVDIQQAVQDAVRNARPRWRDQTEAAGIQVRVTMGVPDMPRARATQQGLHDILINLIFNAVDAMPNGGEIRFSAKAFCHKVQLEVLDTGTGMAEEVRGRLFEPFFTTKAEIGTGLGLYTVYHTIRTFGGDIEVESEPGKGSTFWITLAEMNVDSELQQKSTDTVGPETDRCRILIVEDEAFVGNFLETALSDQHDLFIYENPAQALDSIAKKSYDLVVADLGLPA